jgi:aspartate/methionine/tyrosine aminotransferase
VSTRLDAVPFSPIRAVLARATELEAEGAHISHFELGRPDFDTPEVIKRAAADALHAGHVHYGPNLGIPELRMAIAAKLERQNRLTYDPGAEILVTAGLSEGVLATFMALLEPGDQVVFPEPAWPHYAACARLCGAEPVGVETSLEGGFLPDPEAVEAAIGPRTRALVVNSPNNPTGAVYPAALLGELGRIAERHGLTLISDEIYEQLVWDETFVSSAAVASNWPYTVTLNGFSKAFSMTGWRIGYVAAPKPVLDRILKIHQYNTVCVSTFSQYGAVAAYEHAEHEQAEMRAEFAHRRAHVVRELKDIPQLALSPPAGAFYAFPRIELPLPSNGVSRALLEQGHVATVPGDAFGESGAGHLRLSFATGIDELRDGLGRMREVLAELDR